MMNCSRACSWMTMDLLEGIQSSSDSADIRIDIRQGFVRRIDMHT